MHTCTYYIYLCMYYICMYVLYVCVCVFVRVSVCAHTFDFVIQLKFLKCGNEMEEECILDQNFHKEIWRITLHHIERIIY